MNVTARGGYLILDLSSIKFKVGETTLPTGGGMYDMLIKNHKPVMIVNLTYSATYEEGGTTFESVKYYEPFYGAASYNTINGEVDTQIDINTVLETFSIYDDNGTEVIHWDK